MPLAETTTSRSAIDLLQRGLERGRLAHAFLFSGGNLDRLELPARTLAQTVNCQRPSRVGANGIPIEACGSCSSCIRIAAFNHPDVSWIRPELKSRVIGIGQMREVMQRINLKPTEARFKVACLVAADRLTAEAGNAFLKTLEEPPPNSLVVLLSTEPQQVLETIVSRCMRLAFGGDLEIAAPALAWLADFSQRAAAEQGGLFQRYRLLSLLLKRLSEIRKEVEGTLAENSPLEKHDEVESDLRARWEEELVAATEAEYRRRRGELLVGLEWWFRDLWFKTQNVGGGLLKFPDLAAQVAAIAKRINSREARENIVVIEQTCRLLNSNVQEALTLEVGFLRLRF